MNASIPFAAAAAALALGGCVASGPMGPVGAPAKSDLPWEQIGRAHV